MVIPDEDMSVSLCQARLTPLQQVQMACPFSATLLGVCIARKGNSFATSRS